MFINPYFYSYTFISIQYLKVEHALVLIHSIKTSKTTYPILAVVNDDISSQSEGYFLSLGAVIVRAHNADCNVAKMALWSLTSYNKIIYIDSGSVMTGVS